MNPTHTPQQAADLAQFDPRSGSFLERLLFNHRVVVVVLCAVVTVLLGWQAGKLRLNASFEKAIPAGHPYIATRSPAAKNPPAQKTRWSHHLPGAIHRSTARSATGRRSPVSFVASAAIVAATATPHVRFPFRWSIHADNATNHQVASSASDRPVM